MFDVNDFPELMEIRVRCRELARTQEYLERRFMAITGLSEDWATDLLCNRPLMSDAKFRLEVLELLSQNTGVVNKP